MIAYCGLDCLKCECYIATQENDRKKRQDVAAKWSVQYNTEVKPEQINCNGCKSDGIKFFFTESMCEIRKCCMEKELENCAVCEMYICDRLKAFIALAPEVDNALDKLRIKDKRFRFDVNPKP